MKKSTIILILILLGLMFCSGTAIGADVTAAVDVNSAYVWRGITFNDGVVIQPSVDVSHKGFGFNVWGNIDGDDYNETLDEGELSEVDFTLSYGFDAGPVGITAGYIEYLFPTTASGGGEATSEIFISAGVGIEGFSAGIDIYRDIDESGGTYASLSASYGFDVIEKLSMEIGACAGYGDKDFTIGNDGGLHDYNATLSANYAATDAFGVGCFIAYTDSFDKDVLPEVPSGGTGGQDINVYGGVNISYAF